MSGLLGLKETIIKESQDYYTAKSNEDKRKHKENLQKHFKKFHYYRKNNQEDYQFIKKLIENITQEKIMAMYGKLGKRKAKAKSGSMKMRADKKAKKSKSMYA